MLVKAILEGFGGGKSSSKSTEVVDIPDAVMVEMQNSAIAAITAKAGSRLPLVQGKDKGLPKSAPVFDIEELRKRNMEIKARKQSRG